MCDTDTYIGTDRMQDVMAVLSCRVQRFQDAVVPTGQRIGESPSFLPSLMIPDRFPSSHHLVGLFLHLWFYFLSLL